jgi:hypothetical protein
MAALSDYLESGILSHIFKNQTFAKPSTIAIALTSGVPKDSDNGLTITELPSGFLNSNSLFVSTNYSRVNLGSPSSNGNSVWNNVGVDNITGYFVYSEEVNHSGYFYPLYLSQTAAAAANTGGANTTSTFSFKNTFPGVTFYAPTTLLQSGVSTTPTHPEYEGNGFIKNTSEIVFNTAHSDWGWISGVAILDNSTYGSGNLLMYAELQNPRYVYTGDTVRFDSNTLEISLK